MNRFPVNTLCASLLSACLAAGLAIAAQAQAPAPSAVVAPSDDSLFQQLGSRPGVARLVDELVERSAADARIGAFFKDTKLSELKKQLTDQLCQVTGGPCVYEGATMADAHADMKLAKRDFLAMVEVLQQVMDRQDVPFAVQNRLLALLAPMHRDIVTVR